MTDVASSAGYTPVAAPADDGDGSNAVQRGVGRIWDAGSSAAQHTADWVGHNSSALIDVAGDTAETLLGGAATVAGAALVVSGATACAASTPLVLTGVGAVVTAGACASGLAAAAAGATLATAGAAAMADGTSKLGHDLNRLERTGNAGGGDSRSAESALESLPPAVRADVEDAVQRAASGKVRFPGHDGKVYNNSDNLLPQGGNYTEWTAAIGGAKRGANRVIIDGNPANPDAIYYWDHVNPPVWIGP